MDADRHGGALPAQDEELVLPSVPQSVSQVRRYAVAACTALGYDGDCDTLALLVSEVATNALIHGAGQVRVRVLHAGPRMRIEVSDDSVSLPVPRRAGTDAEGGRGLALVEALAADWGVEARDTGKTVWFELGG
jgi:anti-sigma regulatory factor (Ser/Thr protein kinase)